MRINPITHWLVMNVVLATFASAPVMAENFERGQELFENQCGECHNKSVPLNENHKATTLSALRERIASWAAHTGSEWGNSELDDVSYYLNKSFYHFTDKKI